MTKHMELRECAAGWEPGARLLGNVTAAEIVEVCDALEAAEATLAAVREVTRWEPCVCDADDEDGPVFQGFLIDENGTWMRTQDILTLLRAKEGT